MDKVKIKCKVHFNESKNKKIGNLIITNDFVCMVFEPLLVGIIGFAFWIFFDSPIGMFFILCAVALFYEEYKPYWRRREKIQDKIDAEYEVEKIKAALKAYDDGSKSSGNTGARETVPVAFASAGDFELYREAMKNNSTNTDAASII